MEYLTKEDLVVGETYICKARNFTCGIWNGKEFEYIRNVKFKDTEQHYDEKPYGTVKPYKKA